LCFQRGSRFSQKEKGLRGFGGCPGLKAVSQLEGATGVRDG